MNGSETRCRESDMNRNLNLLGCGLTFAVLAGAYMLALRPLRAESAESESRVAETVSFLNSSDTITSETRRLTLRLSELGQEMERILAGVPESSRESEFLGQLAELLRDSSLTLEEFRPGTVRESGQYRQLEVEVTGEGTYRDLCRFLDGLEKLPRLCRILRMEISSDDQSEARYPIRMTLVIFFAPSGALDGEEQSKATGP